MKYIVVNGKHISYQEFANNWHRLRCRQRAESRLRICKVDPDNPVYQSSLDAIYQQMLREDNYMSEMLEFLDLIQKDVDDG